jgi:D-alanine-D-alanine ligase
MKVAVIQGGPSGEAEVSRKSAEAVAGALARAGHEAQRFELDGDLPRALDNYRPDVVFPAVHGTQGEDGCLQGLLEILGLPYVGSDVRSSAVAADKWSAKVFFRNAGLTVADERRLTQSDRERNASELLAELRAQIGPDLVLKPAQGGSTIGIERVFRTVSDEDFVRALSDAFGHDDFVLVETYVSGKELTCAVIDDENGPRAFPVTLITSSATDWYDFVSKYSPGGSAHLCPAPLSEAETEAVQKAAVAAHGALGARDLSRSDFILAEDGTAYLLELNSLPGMTEVSLYPEAARAAGMSFPDLVDHLVRRAATRGARSGGIPRPLPGP